MNATVIPTVSAIASSIPVVAPVLNPISFDWSGIGQTTSFITDASNTFWPLVIKGVLAAFLIFFAIMFIKRIGRC